MTQFPASLRRSEQDETAPLLSRIEPNLLVVTVLGLAAAAWTATALLHLAAAGASPAALDVPDLHSGRARSPQHGGATSAADGSSVVLAGGVLGVTAWALMVVAMMLPPALPLLQTVRRLVSRRPHPGMLSFLGALTVVTVWTLLGVGLVAGDLAVRALWAGQGWASARPEVVTGAVLVAAGLYQFSPLKDLCLRGCRSPRSFALAHWRGHRSPHVEVARMTGAYALSCVGCCWALMLLCFVVGAAALPVMVVLAVFMAAERLVPWGRRLARPAGAGLLLLGTATVIGVVPTSLIR